MQNSIYLIISVLFFFQIIVVLQLFYQPSYSFKGKVVDQLSGEPLIGVKVQVSDNKKPIYTGIDGQFKFSLNEPCEILLLSYTGYHKCLQSICIENLNRKEELIFELSEIDGEVFYMPFPGNMEPVSCDNGP